MRCSTKRRMTVDTKIKVVMIDTKVTKVMEAKKRYDMRSSRRMCIFTTLRAQKERQKTSK